MPSLPLPGGGLTAARWRQLAAIAERDLCLVKVLEAHYDAQAILAELGCDGIRPGELWAVWAAEPPDARLGVVVDGRGAGLLRGTKAWCTGADIATHALVTAWQGDERYLVRVRMDEAGLSAAATEWPAVGMSRAVSGPLHFEDVPCTIVGGAGAYLARPGFWHGGAGIAACWYGGACAVTEVLRRHPRVRGNPLAAMHLGAIDIALAGCAAMLRTSSEAIDAEPGQPQTLAVLRLRCAVERAATVAIDRVGRALGAGPLCTDVAHAQRCADLATFVRQSHADRDWQDIGEFVAGEADPWRF